MKIHIYHATAGHGHKKIAEVIGETFKKRGFDAAQVEVIDILEKTPGFFKAAYPASYFYSVKYAPKTWGWFYESLDKAGFYRALYPFRSLNNQIMGSRALAEAIEAKPDVIITSHFFSAELFATAKRKKKLNSLLITVVTDFFPHTFWVNEGTDFYWVMSEEGKGDLLQRGIPESKIIVGGIPVADAFKPSGKRTELLNRWNFEKERFTLLFTSGSFGLGPQEEILKQLTPFKDLIQCLVVCGNNKILQDRLSAQSWPFPIQIHGFVDFMPDLMEASDLMLAKPGGSTTTESLAKGLPMVILDPIPGQESRNAKLLLSRNMSFSLTEAPQIRTILNAIFDNPHLMRDKLQQLRAFAKPNAAEDLVSFVLEKISQKGK
jgi:processive 1,2-diacylglycerol beta-glucosyltransferase